MVKSEILRKKPDCPKCSCPLAPDRYTQEPNLFTCPRCQKDYKITHKIISYKIKEFETFESKSIQIGNPTDAKIGDDWAKYREDLC